MENNCVFCDKSKFEERICGETKDFWIIATLGQITDGGYVLLVPKRHVECIGAMISTEAEKLEKLLSKTQKILRKEYGLYSVVFEHGIVGQTVKHAHLHVVPQDTCRSINISLRIAYDYPPDKVDFYAVPSLSDLHRVYAQKRQPYLLWRHIQEKGFVVCENPPAPPQYLRLVVAELFSRSERGNWRNMDPELDKKLWSETVKRLKPYFS